MVIAFTGFVVLTVDAKKSKDVIQIPNEYEWNYKLNDGILTYSIEASHKGFNAVVDLAMQEWEDAMGKTIRLQKVDNSPFNFGGADIKFIPINTLAECPKCYTDYIQSGETGTTSASTVISNYKSGNTKVILGATVYIPIKDIITDVKQTHPDYEKADALLYLKQTMVHEIGHTLGLGHTHSPESIMYAYTDGIQQDFEVTDCEVYNVFLTNRLYDFAAQIEDDYAEKYDLDSIEEAADKICEIK